MNCAIIIPALNPGTDFIDTVKGLIPSEEKPVIVINDGSKAELTDIFREIGELPFCTVLHHEENKGKGKALKTGFSYFLEHYSHLNGVVTADCDGQHSIEDIISVGEAISRDKRGIVLGVRDFLSEDVPFKNLLANRTGSILFKILYGINVRDTQTGLRGIPTNLINLFLNVKGERFEYEMNMLVECSRGKIAVIQVPIQTIYINNNASRHFKDFEDTIQVSGVLFSGLFRYAGSSIFSALTDIIIFIILNTLVFADVLIYYRLFASIAIARLISSIVNYILNHDKVFKSIGGHKSSIPKYYILWMLQLLTSYGLVLLLEYTTNISSNITKIMVDVLLAFISYQIQLRWVFGGENP